MVVEGPGRKRDVSIPNPNIRSLAVDDPITQSPHTFAHLKGAVSNSIDTNFVKVAPVSNLHMHSSRKRNSL